MMLSVNNTDVIGYTYIVCVVALCLVPSCDVVFFNIREMSTAPATKTLHSSRQIHLPANSERIAEIYTICEEISSMTHRTLLYWLI